MRAIDILSEAAHKEIFEHASSGGTGAGNVATAVGGLGAGFDPNGHHGVYEEPKKKKSKKPLLVRR